MKVPDGQGGEMEMTMAAYPGRWATIDDASNGLIAAIRYVHENADKFGVDASKLVLEGLSGGGYMTHAISSRLAVLGESNLIKLAVTVCALTVGWYVATPDEVMKKKRKETRMGVDFSRYVGNAYAKDKNYDK
jgi:carboxylesterase type B